MSKKAMTFLLVLAAVLLLGLLILRPEKNKQIYEDLNDENEIYDIAQEIIFEEAPLVVEVTEINSDYMVAYEYSSDQEFVGDIEKLDLSSYENTHNEITYSFDGKEVIVPDNAEQTIKVGDMLVLYLSEDGMKTIVKY